MAPSNCPPDGCGSRGSNRLSLLESSLIGRASVSAESHWHRTLIRTQNCQGWDSDKAMFLISGISCPSPMKLFFYRLAGNWSLDNRVTDFLWLWASKGTGSRLLLFTELHSCGNWVLSWCQTLGEGFQFRQKGRQFHYKWSAWALWI
jgi:hypothetical protein